MPSKPLTESELTLTGGDWVTRGLIQVWVPGSSPKRALKVVPEPEPAKPNPRITPCPTCDGVKSRAAKACGRCYAASRTKQIKHGTIQGYRAHQRSGKQACLKCKRASRIATRKYQAEKKRAAA